MWEQEGHCCRGIWLKGAFPSWLQAPAAPRGEHSTLEENARMSEGWGTEPEPQKVWVLVEKSFFSMDHWYQML